MESSLNSHSRTAPGMALPTCGDLTRMRAALRERAVRGGWLSGGVALALATLSACADPSEDLSSARARATNQTTDLTAAESKPQGEDAPATEPGWSHLVSQCKTLSGPSGEPQPSVVGESGEERKAVIRGVSFMGDLCGMPIPSCVTINDGTVNVILSGRLQGSRPEEAVAESCSMKVEMEVPDGYQMGMPTVVWRGIGANADATRTYSFDGEAPAASITDKLPSEDFYLNSDRPKLWSPTCSGSRRTAFIATLDVSFIQRMNLFQLVSFDLATEFMTGVEWRRCNQEAESEPPGQRDETCGGPHNLVCDTSLVCEGVTGGRKKCVDPEEAVPPAPLGGACGGPRGLPCVAGLKCRYPEDGPEDDASVGRCEGERIAQGGDCTPIPSSRPCEEGNYCVASRIPGKYTCSPGTGEQNSRCGEGFPECKSPFVCNDLKSLCLPPVEACRPGTCPDTTDENGMAVTNYCWPARKICVAEVEGRCGGELPDCREGTACDLRWGLCYDVCGDQLPECKGGKVCDLKRGRCVEHLWDDEEPATSEASI